MPTPRRSSRLRSGSATPRKSMGFTANRLASLAEQDDTRTESPSHDSEIVDEPQTPNTGKPKPLHEEMHPSKAQQSTAKQPDSGLRFGFADIGTTANQQTPSKSAVDSAFEFRFARPGPQLSADGQRMMDDLREEAMRVKARLIAERDEAAKAAQAEAEALAVNGRKIAHAKGKVGRFSDVHMAEFRKMDSIADHPSSFRAQAARINTPLKPALKRSQSQAKLQEREETMEEQQPKAPVVSERLENDAPAKRVRKAIADDTSASRPTSRSGISSTPRQQNSTLTALTTPTQSSLARSTVNKPVSQIPSLTKSSSRVNLAAAARLPQTPNLHRSSSKQSLLTTPQRIPQPAIARPTVPRSEPRPFVRSPGKVDRLRSMLRYPGSARKPSGIHARLQTPKANLTQPLIDKQLPALPTTPGGHDGNKTVKHVSFTPDVVNKQVNPAPASPSPMKSSIPRSASKPNMFTKGLTPKHPIFHGAKSGEVEYPSLAGHPSLQDSVNISKGPSGGTRPLPSLPNSAITQSHPPPSVPGTFSFRSDHTIDFGKSPQSFGSSPGQASVRQVRPSIFPAMPGSFPSANKENTAPIPSVPHGLPNKKRHRADSEDVGRGEPIERSSKKVKTDFTYGTSARTPTIEAPKTIQAQATPSPAKKKGLSLSRLNMLARPKQRK